MSRVTSKKSAFIHRRDLWQDLINNGMHYNIFNETLNTIFHLIRGKVMFFTETHSKPCQTPDMELFAKIVNS